LSQEIQPAPWPAIEPTLSQEKEPALSQQRERTLWRKGKPAPVLRICSLLTADADLLPVVEDELTRAFGEIILRSAPVPFDTSDYYREEMGDGLVRRWYCFRDLCGAEHLPEARLDTGRIEEMFAAGGKRRVNLDPGYLDLGKLVLASLKEAPDKMYMGQGVWAHTCLRYRFGAFKAPDHSFPDFKDGRFNDFMLEARKLYRSLLRERDRPD
jgi:hypothetical protein